MISSDDDARSFLRDELACSVATISAIEEFLRMLADENQRQNLVSPDSLAGAWVRHVADSAQLVAVSRETGTNGSWLDLGTGAGFPGLIVALLQPWCETILVESRAKRTAWLARVVSHFNLRNVKVLHRRLETVDTFAASVISARAFAPLARLLSIAERFSTSKTLWLLPKGAKASEELATMPKTVREMFHVEQSLTKSDALVLVGRGVPALTMQANGRR